MLLGVRPWRRARVRWCPYRMAHWPSTTRGRLCTAAGSPSLPAQYSGWNRSDHRPGFLLPGFVDTHVHFPQTYSGDAYGGGQLLEWLNACIFPSESRFADPDFAAAAAVEFCDRRIAAGTTAAVVFGSAFPHAQDALFAETQRRGLGSSAGAASRPSGRSRRRR